VKVWDRENHKLVFRQWLLWRVWKFCIHEIFANNRDCPESLCGRGMICRVNEAIKVSYLNGTEIFS